MSAPRSSRLHPTLARIGLPNARSRAAAATVAVLVGAAALSIGAASEILIATQDWVVGHFGWLFVLVVSASVVGVVCLALHPRARARLGPDDARPEFRTVSWFAMLFSAGLASGLLYWATAEPILHYQGNPFLDGAAAESEAAVTTAIRLTVLHWGLHGWALYVVAGLGIAIQSYRHGGPLSFRSALHPVLGRHVDRWPGLAVDLVALFGTVCGVATSIGISAGGMNATLGSLLGLDVTIPSQIVIVFGVCALGILSAVSGLARGIRRLSELNVWVSGLLLLAFVLLGPTLFVAGLFVETLVDYTLHVLPTGWWLATTPEQQEWQSSWTVFYWGWWLAWTPFVSLFIARISRGRTIREFAIAVMLVPTLVTVLWMSVLGGTALHQELAAPGSVAAAVGQDPSLGIVAVIRGLEPSALAAPLVLTAGFLLFTWMITSLDSATLVICHLLGVEEESPAKAFWGLALAAVTSVLLLVGGLPALQATSVAVGLPLAVVMVFVGGGIAWEFVRRGDRS